MMTIKSHLKIRISWSFVTFVLLVVGLFSSPSKAVESVTNATMDLPPNAYFYYLKALEIQHPALLTDDIPPPSPPPDMKRPSQKDSEFDNKKTAAEIKADAEALEIVRQGFAFKYQKVQPDSGPFPDVNISFNSGMREIARMLAKESDAKAANGDWEGAASSALDGIRLGQDISHGSIIDMLAGRSIQAIVSKSLYNVLDHADVKIDKEVVTRLTKILSQKVQYADLLQTEKQTGLWLYGQMATTPDWRKENHVTTTKSLEQLKGEYLSAIDGLVANARLSYPQRKKSISAPDDSVNQLLLGLFSNPKYLNSGITQGTALATQQTKSAFILVEFALRAYQLDHQKYPQTLAELKPNYLKEIPDDPFSANQPLQYKNEKTKYTLYSIGPDNKDDGGKPISGKHIYPDSSGDILFDVEGW